MRYSRTAIYPAEHESVPADVGGVMPADPRLPYLVSRRTVTGAAGALPFMHAASAAPAGDGDGVLNRCRTWLAGEADLDRLNRRWSAIEGRIMKRREPGQGTDVPFGTPQERADMAALDRRLAVSSGRQAERLDALTGMSPSTLAEAAGLMIVAAHLMRYEGDPSHELICNALAVVAAKA